MKTIKASRLIFLFSLAYMVSYLTRINYSAVISAIEASTGFSKQLLSMALTGSFITYGAGQIFSGILGDRFSPKKLLLIGLGTTVLMNILITFCTSPWAMAGIWSINGLAQAFMWPPIVRLMTALLTKDEYTTGVVKVSWGSSIGTIIIYILAPVIITIAGWKGVFFFSAICGIIMIFLWQIYCPEIDLIEKTNEQSPVSTKAKVFTPVFFIMACAIVLCGMLRDGVAAWTPSLISESFNLSNASGILSGALLPVFGMICYEVALILYRKRFKNPIVCAGIIFLAGALSSLILNCALNKSSILSVLSIALLNGSMYGVNLMFTGILPSFYAKTGRVSTVSGILNSFVYIGSALSTYGIAVLTESFGWSVTIWVWLGLAVLGAIISFAVATPWKTGLEK